VCVCVYVCMCVCVCLCFCVPPASRQEPARAQQSRVPTSVRVADVYKLKTCFYENAYTRVQMYVCSIFACTCACAVVFVMKYTCEGGRRWLDMCEGVRFCMRVDIECQRVHTQIWHLFKNLRDCMKLNWALPGRREPMCCSLLGIYMNLNVYVYISVNIGI